MIKFTYYDCNNCSSEAYFEYIGFIKEDKDFYEYMHPKQNELGRDVYTKTKDEFGIIVQNIITNASINNEIIYDQEEFIMKIHKFMSKYTTKDNKYCLLFSDLTTGIYVFREIKYQ